MRYTRTLLRLVVKIIQQLLRTKPQLNRLQKRHITERWQAVQTITDPTQQIIEAEKVMTYTMKALGYTGSFAEQLQKVERVFGKKQSLWTMHKIRNRIVHESGVIATKHDAKNVCSAYYSFIQQLL